MNAFVAEKLAQIQALSSEVCGMQAENQHRSECGYSIAYDAEAFQKKADELRQIATELNQFRGMGLDVS